VSTPLADRTETAAALSYLGILGRDAALVALRARVGALEARIETIAADLRAAEAVPPILLVETEYERASCRRSGDGSPLSSPAWNRESWRGCRRRRGTEASGCHGAAERRRDGRGVRLLVDATDAAADAPDVEHEAGAGRMPRLHEPRVLVRRGRTRDRAGLEGGHASRVM